MQEEELEMAVLGKGEYKLRDQYSHILVDPQQWDKMTDGQKKLHFPEFMILVSKIFCQLL